MTDTQLREITAEEGIGAAGVTLPIEQSVIWEQQHEAAEGAALGTFRVSGNGKRIARWVPLRVPMRAVRATFMKHGPVWA